MNDCRHCDATEANCKAHRSRDSRMCCDECSDDETSHGEDLELTDPWSSAPVSA